MSLITFGLGASAARLLLLGFAIGDAVELGRADSTVYVPSEVFLMTVEAQPPIVVPTES